MNRYSQTEVGRDFTDSGKGDNQGRREADQAAIIAIGLPMDKLDSVFEWPGVEDGLQNRFEASRHQPARNNIEAHPCRPSVP